MMILPFSVDAFHWGVSVASYNILMVLKPYLTDILFVLLRRM